MSIFRKLSRTCRNPVHRDRLEADLDAELRAYVDLSAGQKDRAGMSAAEMEQVKELVRDVRAGSRLETVFRDIRFGARLLGKNPGFTAAAVAMLALGIGANTAVFPVVNVVLLRGLPYVEPDRIVALYEKRPREDNLWNLAYLVHPFLPEPHLDGELFSGSPDHPLDALHGASARIN